MTPLTEDQLRAMEAMAPLLVAEVRRLRTALYERDVNLQKVTLIKDQYAGACDLFKARIVELEQQVYTLTGKK